MKLKFAALLFTLAAPVSAQPVTPAEQAWNALARADAEAALELIEHNHPGAVPELGDLRSVNC